jgi:hypothetical protein
MGSSPRQSSHHAPRDESGDRQDSILSRPLDDAGPLHDPARFTPSVKATLLTSASGLRLEFVQHHDRYSHRIVAADGAILLCSIEGTDQDIWPASPPLQQLSIEEHRPGVEVALLVGMAGKSHWSLSIEPLADGSGFLFDVACRLRDAAGWLGSSYQLASPSPPQLHFAPLPIAADSSSCHVEQRECEARVTPVVGDGGVSGTVRWKYSIATPS